MSVTGLYYRGGWGLNRRLASLLSYILAALSIYVIYRGYLLWECCLEGGEGRFFFVMQLGQHAWTLTEVYSWLYGDYELLKDLKGDDVLLKHNISQIYISHYHLAHERAAFIAQQMFEHGITKYQLCSNWDRESVLDPSNVEEMSKLMWTDAKSILTSTHIKTCHIKRYIPTHQADNDTKLERLSPGLLGRIANQRQHFDMWQKALDQGMERLLVLEDDALFVPQFNARLDIYLNQIPSDFDIVFIGGCAGRHAPLKGVSTQVSPNVHHVTRHRCASGYIIPRHSMEKLLSFSTKKPSCYMNIDPYLESYMGSILSQSYWVEPPLSYESSKTFFTNTYSYRYASKPPKI